MVRLERRCYDLYELSWIDDYSFILNSWNTPNERKIGKSVILLSGLLGGCTDVVLDCANIIHGGSNGDGMNGKRIVSAIKYYEHKGYFVHAVLKKETYHYMKKQKVHGLADIENLIKDGKIQLYRKNDDHLAIVMAIEHHSWLITHDTFKTHNDAKPRERHTNPEWFENGSLDKRTRGTSVQDDGWISSGYDWHVEGEIFYDPEIADINFLKKWHNSDNKSLVRDAHLIEKNLMKLNSMVDKLDDISVEQKDLVSQCQENIKHFINSLSDNRNSLDIKSIINDLNIYDLKQICHNRSIKIAWPLEKIKDERYGFDGVKKTTALTVNGIKKLLDSNQIPYKKSWPKNYLTQVYYANLGNREKIEKLIIDDISKRGLFLFHKDNMNIYCLEMYVKFNASYRSNWDKLYSK